MGISGQRGHTGRCRHAREGGYTGGGVCIQEDADIQENVDILGGGACIREDAKIKKKGE